MGSGEDLLYQRASAVLQLQQVTEVARVKTIDVSARIAMRGLFMAIGAVVVCSAPAYTQRATGGVSLVPSKKAVVGDPRLVRPKFSADTTVFVPNEWPVFIDGRRIDPVDGGHTVVVSHSDGILVDGVVYMPVPEDPPEPEPVKLEDGFDYYVLVKPGELGRDAIKNGASPEEARQIMLDFWAQYADSVEVVAGEWSADVTYLGDIIGVPFPQPIPENMPPRPTPFERLLGPAERLVGELNAGYLVLRSGACMVRIGSNDAAQAVDELARVPDRAEVWGYLDDEVVYRGVPIVNGMYGLCPTMVKDLIRNQEHGGE